jgi:hypothetical protein
VLGLAMFGYADRGIRSKSRNNISLNISTNKSFKNSLAINSKSGLKYKGLYFIDNTTNNNESFSSTIRTYQKGNTVYLLPEKNKKIIPEIKLGYTGMKLIFKKG